MGEGSLRPADPWPQLFPDLTKTQALAMLDEINHRAVVLVVPDREIDVVAIAIELDDHLIAAVPHHRGTTPALALVEGIALLAAYWRRSMLRLKSSSSRSRVTPFPPPGPPSRFHDNRGRPVKEERPLLEPTGLPQDLPGYSVDQPTPSMARPKPEAIQRPNLGKPNTSYSGKQSIPTDLDGR